MQQAAGPGCHMIGLKKGFVVRGAAGGGPRGREEEEIVAQHDERWTPFVVGLPRDARAIWKHL